MAEKGSFLLRTNPEILTALRIWAEDEFRSANGQMEFVLRKALRDAGRLSDGGKSPDHADRNKDTSGQG